MFASDKPFSEIDTAINTENANFTYPNDLVTFFDSHDESRLLNMNNNRNRLHEAMAFILTGRGIPIILYGDEQYLFEKHQQRQRSLSIACGCHRSARPRMPTS